MRNSYEGPPSALQRGRYLACDDTGGCHGRCRCHPPRPCQPDRQCWTRPRAGQLRGRVPGSNIHTLGESVWWSVVTVTTAGYGDYTPVTVDGRITAACIMGIGLLTWPGSAARVPAGQDRPDDPQDREDKPDQAQHPMALAEAENGEDQQQDKIDDA